MLREIFQRSKQQDFYQEFLIFTITGIYSSSYPTGLPCQNGKFYSFCTYIFNFFRRTRAIFWGLAGHFLPAGPQVGNHWLRSIGKGQGSISLTPSNKGLVAPCCRRHWISARARLDFSKCARVNEIYIYSPVQQEQGQSDKGGGRSHCPRGTDATKYRQGFNRAWSMWVK